MILTGKFRLIGLGLALSLSTSAQELGFQDELLDRFSGNWILNGEIAGDDIIHHVDARWVLGHQYLQFDETIEKGEIVYEANVFIGWDEPTGR